MLFTSTDKRPVVRRVSWTLAGVLLGLLTYVALHSQALLTWEKAGISLIAILVSFPAFSIAWPRTARYEIASDRVRGTFGGIERFCFRFKEIEYVGYTAETRFSDGIRYDPWAGGILYLATQPGFHVTLDLRRPHVVRLSWLLRVHARRVLITLDEPQAFVAELRNRVELAK